jgi:hypothetical protein
VWRMAECEMMRDGGSYSVVLKDEIGIRSISLWLRVDHGRPAGERRHLGLYFCRGEGVPMHGARPLTLVEEHAWLDALRCVSVDGIDERGRERLAELIALVSDPTRRSRTAASP